MASIVSEIKITKISPNRRLVCDSDSIEELCLSIKCRGQEEPIRVCFAGQDLRILDGEKRWRACRKLGLTKIKAIIVETEEQE